MKKIIIVVLVGFLFTACYKSDPQVISLLNQIKSQNDSLRFQIVSLQRRTDSLANALKSTNSSITNLDRKIDSLRSQINLVLGQISSLNAQLASANANILDLQAKISELYKKCEELTKLLNEYLLLGNSSVSVVTTIIDVSSSPLVVGGNVTVAGIDSVYEKGVIIGTAKNLTLDTVYSNFYYWSTSVMSLHTGGWTKPSNTKATIKSKSGRGTFQLKVNGTYGNTLYYVRAYAKTKSQIIYGNEVSVNTVNYSRDSKQFDFANVFWQNQYTLFDLLTDEIIRPNSNGVYTFWYSSNEDPRVYQTTKTSTQLSSFLFYKFKTQASCQLWCDLKTGRLIPTN